MGGLKLTDATRLKTFQKEFKIDNDSETAIPLSKLLQAAIETSGEHDQTVNSYIKNQGEYLIKENQTWVITQYNIKVHELPKYGEKFVITTKVVEANRFFISRRFEIKVADQMMVELFAQFTAIDFEERKMVRLNVKTFLEAGLLTEGTKPSYPRIKLPDSSQVDSFLTKYHQVVSEDIDTNQHVNNGAYLNWIEEQLSQIIHNKYHQVELHIKYGKEILPDEQVKIETYIENIDSNIVTTHLIKNLSQEAEACRIQIYWINKD